MSHNKGPKPDKAGIKICPECARAFYAVGKQDATCTFCGHRFIDKRAGGRVRTNMSFLMKAPDELIPAEVEDYSKTGIRLAYRGKPLDIDSIVDLDISELAIKVKARAVWTRKSENDFSRTGFMFIKHEKERFYAQ